MSKTLRAAKPKAVAVTHTPTPWEFDGNCGGYISEGGDKIARAYAREDAKFIVQAVNCHAAMAAKLCKVIRWLEVLAADAEVRAKDKRFLSLAEANAADVKNYRATIADIKSVLPTDPGSVT